MEGATAYAEPMPFWKRREPNLPEQTEPMNPMEFIALTESLGRACADEVQRLGGDASQILGTVWFTEKQEVSRVQLTSDGTPMPTVKKFNQDLTERAARLRAQPEGSRLDRLEVTVVDGRLTTNVTYRD